MSTLTTPFLPSLPRAVPPDPGKHVNYALGMVLGVDDFTQEFAYLSERDRWLARDAIGYGTLWGLRLRVEVDDRGPRVEVAPGVAITPCGHLVCVSPAQCAYLNDWLAAHAPDVLAAVASPAAPLSVWVLLRYRDCETDRVPIPGEPCRGDEDLMAPSRIADGFELELALRRPAQREEDALVDVVAWLRAVPVVDGPGSALEELLDALRAMAAAAETSPPGSPPGSPPPAAGSPPSALAIPRDAFAAHVRAAFRLWTTELRPAARGRIPGCECGCDGPCGCPDGDAGAEARQDDVVLLGELRLPLVFPGGGVAVADTGWEVHEEERPTVLHLRMLQEWVLSERAPDRAPEPLSPPAPGSPPSPGSPPALGASWEAVPLGAAPGVALDPVTGDLHFRLPGTVSASAEAVPLGAAPGVALDPATGDLHFRLPGTVSASAQAVPLGAAPGVALDPATGDLRFRLPGTVSAVATTLPAGSAATAALDPATGRITLGVPRGPQGAPGQAQSLLVAGGLLQADGSPQWSFGGLSGVRLDPTLMSVPTFDVYFVKFDVYDPARRFLVTGTPLVLLRDVRAVFELLWDDGGKLVPPGLEKAARELGLDAGQGLWLRVGRIDNAMRERSWFQVEIHDVTDLP